MIVTEELVGSSHEAVGLTQKLVFDVSVVLGGFANGERVRLLQQGVLAVMGSNRHREHPCGTLLLGGVIGLKVVSPQQVWNDQGFLPWLGLVFMVTGGETAKDFPGSWSLCDPTVTCVRCHFQQLW